VLIHTLQVGMLQTNCYIVGCEGTRQAVIIDPGGDGQRILNVVRHERLQVRYVLNTHAHFDHIGANAEVVAATGAPLALHRAELPILQDGGGARWFGVDIRPSPPPALELTDGQELAIGQLSLRVLHLPGHSPGGLGFHVPESQAVFSGDVLFAGGMGRTDLPGGDWAALQDSIALPDETQVDPGHGPATSIGHEKRHNPWFGRGEQRL
jgi:hydroxyacylglutathione hydrolase